MTYSDDEVRRQLLLGEDSNWEFKEVVFADNRLRGPRRDDLADEIAAFANARGGMLLCSVTDEGEVLEMSREQMNQLEILIADVCTVSIRPPIRVDIFRKDTFEGKSLLMVDVPEGHAQHDSPGGSFIRVGSTKRKMTSEERLRLAQRRGQASFLWFDKQPVDGTGFGTLDEALWKPLVSAEGAADPELALEKMGLLAVDQNGTLRATVAGVLLCSSSPDDWLPNACITATRYRGADRASGQLDSQIIDGPINKQVREALAFAVRNMSVAARKEPARQDLPQYSERALFEALVNAVVHRDYSIRGSRIRLAMFDDRLEICSPGSLPNNLTIESMYERQSTRNEVLTSILGRMNVGAIEGGGGRTVFHGAARRWRSNNSTGNSRTKWGASQFSIGGRSGTVPYYPRCSTGIYARERCDICTWLRGAIAGCRCLSAVPEQNLETRRDRRQWGGKSRFAFHSSTDGCIRGRCRLYPGTGTKLDSRRKAVGR